MTLLNRCLGTCDSHATTQMIHTAQSFPCMPSRWHRSVQLTVPRLESGSCILPGRYNTKVSRWQVLRRRVSGKATSSPPQNTLRSKRLYTTKIYVLKELAPLDNSIHHKSGTSMLFNAAFILLPTWGGSGRVLIYRLSTLVAKTWCESASAIVKQPTRLHMLPRLRALPSQTRSEIPPARS